MRISVLVGNFNIVFDSTLDAEDADADDAVAHAATKETYNDKAAEDDAATVFAAHEIM